VNLAQAGGRETERLSLCAPNRLWISSTIHLEAKWDALLDSLKKSGIIPMEVTMATTPVMATTAKIATALGLTESELFRQALVSFLREQKRQVLQHRLDILARYGADSIADLESRIAKGVVVEHPAWEDLIVAENLTARLEELDAYLGDLQGTEDDRPE